MGNHDTRWCLRPGHSRHDRDIPRADTCRNRQVDLVQTSTGQAREGRCHADVVDAKINRIGRRHRSGEHLSGRYGWVARNKGLTGWVQTTKFVGDYSPLSQVDEQFASVEIMLFDRRATSLGAWMITTPRSAPYQPPYLSAACSNCRTTTAMAPRAS